MEKKKKEIKDLDRKYTANEYHLVISHNVYNEPDSSPEILDSFRFCLLFELYEQNLNTDSIIEIQNLCNEIIEMTKKTPNQLKEYYDLETDENGTLL